MKVIRMNESGASQLLADLRASLGVDQGLVADWQTEVSDRSPLESVREVLSAVRDRGDDAVVEYTRTFDKAALTPDELRVPQSEIDQAVKATSPEVILAM